MKLADLDPRKVVGFRNRTEATSRRDPEAEAAWQTECAQTRGYRKRDMIAPRPTAGGQRKRRTMRLGSVPAQVLEQLAIRPMSVVHLANVLRLATPKVSSALDALQKADKVERTLLTDTDHKGRGRAPTLWKRL